MAQSVQNWLMPSSGQACAKLFHYFIIAGLCLSVQLLVSCRPIAPFHPFKAKLKYCLLLLI